MPLKTLKLHENISNFYLKWSMKKCIIWHKVCHQPPLRIRENVKKPKKWINSLSSQYLFKYLIKHTFDHWFWKKDKFPKSFIEVFSIYEVIHTEKRVLKSCTSKVGNDNFCCKFFKLRALSIPPLSKNPHAATTLDKNHWRFSLWIHRKMNYLTLFCLIYFIFYSRIDLHCRWFYF